VTPELHALYIDAGLHEGRKRTCLKRKAYAREAAEDTYAYSTELEAYPCAFCAGWHVGPRRSVAELQATAQRAMTEADLASIPTSLLLRDVVAHACDRLDGDQLCERCRGKWDEIDRRLPPRKP